jgi:hypothetical protein
LPQYHVVFDVLFETVNCTGFDELFIEAICQGLFQCKRELYAEEELNEAGNIIYQPPLLHKVWLDETGQRQGNKDRLCPSFWNNDLMHERNRVVKEVIPTPVATDLDDDDVPDVTQNF